VLSAMGYMTEQVDAHNEVTPITLCRDLKAVTVPFEGKLSFTFQDAYLLLSTRSEIENLKVSVKCYLNRMVVMGPISIMRGQSRALLSFRALSPCAQVALASSLPQMPTPSISSRAETLERAHIEDTCTRFSRIRGAVNLAVGATRWQVIYNEEYTALSVSLYS